MSDMVRNYFTSPASKNVVFRCHHREGHGEDGLLFVMMNEGQSPPNICSGLPPLENSIFGGGADNCLAFYHRIAQQKQQQ